MNYTPYTDTLRYTRLIYAALLCLVGIGIKYNEEE